MEFFLADLDTADVLEEQQRDRALKPFLEVLFHLILTVTILDGDAYSGEVRCGCSAVRPLWFGESILLEGYGQGRGSQLNALTEAECALKADSTKTDGVKRPLV